MRVFDESESRRLRMFENKVAGSVFGSNREEVRSVFGSNREEVRSVFGSKR